MMNYYYLYYYSIAQVVFTILELGLIVFGIFKLIVAKNTDERILGVLIIILSVLIMILYAVKTI